MSWFKADAWSKWPSEQLNLLHLHDHRKWKLRSSWSPWTADPIRSRAISIFYVLDGRPCKMSQCDDRCEARDIMAQLVMHRLHNHYCRGLVNHRLVTGEEYDHFFLRTLKKTDFHPNRLMTVIAGVGGCISIVHWNQKWWVLMGKEETRHRHVRHRLTRMIIHNPLKEGWQPPPFNPADLKIRIIKDLLERTAKWSQT